MSDASVDMSGEKKVEVAMRVTDATAAAEEAQKIYQARFNSEFNLIRSTEKPMSVDRARLLARCRIHEKNIAHA